jgi:hypothetical protein
MVAHIQRVDVVLVAQPLGDRVPVASRSEQPVQHHQMLALSGFETGQLDAHRSNPLFMPVWEPTRLARSRETQNANDPYNQSSRHRRA